MFILKTLRMIFITLDNIIYQLVDLLYQLFMMLAETGIFTTEDIRAFSERIYFFLGLIMVFKVSISLLQYIMNPDAAQDGKIGAPKLLKNIVFVLAGIVLVPYIFDAAFSLQRIILSDNIIGNLILGTNYTDSGDSTNTNNVVKQAGDRMAFTTFTAFFHFNDDYIGSACYSAPYDENGNVTEACTKDPNYNDILEEFLDIDTKTGKLYKEAYKDMNMHKLALRPSLYNATFEADDGEDEFVFDYMLLVTSASGLFIAYILLVFCFDVAVRSVKLGFLQLIAPIPLIAKIDPKKGDEVFNKWVKECTSTYLNLFIRLVSIYFALYIISIVSVFNPYNVITKDDINNPFVKVFIILGTLLFVKDLPKLIETITGMKIDTKGFGIKNKLGQTPLVGGKLANGLSRLEGRARASGRKFMQNRAGNMAKTLSGNTKGKNALSRGWNQGFRAFEKSGIGTALGAKEKLSKLNAKGQYAIDSSQRAYDERINASKREGMEREKSAGWLGDSGYKGTTIGKTLKQAKFKEMEAKLDGDAAFGKIAFNYAYGERGAERIAEALKMKDFKDEDGNWIEEAKSKVFSSFNGIDRRAYDAIYQNEEFKSALMKYDKADTDLKQMKAKYEAAMASPGQYSQEELQDIQKAYDKQIKITGGLEETLKTMRASYSEDAEIESALKAFKNNSEDPTGQSSIKVSTQKPYTYESTPTQQSIESINGINYTATEHGAPTAENSIFNDISASYLAGRGGSNSSGSTSSSGSLDIGTNGSMSANISQESMNQMARIMGEAYSQSAATAMKDAFKDMSKQLSQDISTSVRDAVSEPLNKLNSNMSNVTDSLSQVEKRQRNMAEIIDDNTEAIEEHRKADEDDLK